jgi:hypothetical protein
VYVEQVPQNVPQPAVMPSVTVATESTKTQVPSAVLWWSSMMPWNVAAPAAEQAAIVRAGTPQRIGTNAPSEQRLKALGAP